MQIKNILFAAALSTTAVADFVVITSIPTPTAIPDLSNLRSYINSLENFVTSKIGELTASLGPSALSQAASAQTALASFVATASYDIPDEVTKIGGLETFTTVPTWYSALPSDLKSYYDANNARVQSLINEAVNGASAANTGASPTGTGARPQSTGAAPSSAVKALGAGVAAAFVGVLAL
ncbi:hypothetical protein BKA66DRAFT_568743 [Pyrenochaeta sp. MPI-SDFR-AT-0127]|nr:hypothetical protein BKA66DRAFT_568743 [Pyrenochaeta sp. MPI-SDFR-AT-0127]